MKVLNAGAVLIFLVIVRNSSEFAVSLNNALDIIKLAKDVALAVAKAWDIVDQHVDFGDIPIPLLDKTESKLFRKIEKIATKLDSIAKQIDTTGTLTITSILRTLPNRLRLELRLNDLLDYLTRMDVVYNRFGNYVKKKKDFERLTLDDFAKYVVSHDSSSVNSLLERIHVFVVPVATGIVDTGLIQLLGKVIEVTRSGLKSFCL